MGSSTVDTLNAVVATYFSSSPTAISGTNSAPTGGVSTGHDISEVASSVLAIELDTATDVTFQLWGEYKNLPDIWFLLDGTSKNITSNTSIEFEHNGLKEVYIHVTASDGDVNVYFGRLAKENKR